FAPTRPHATTTKRRTNYDSRRSPHCDLHRRPAALTAILPRPPRLPGGLFLLLGGGVRGAGQNCRLKRLLRATGHAQAGERLSGAFPVREPQTSAGGLAAAGV